MKWLWKKGLFCSEPACRRCGRKMKFSMHSGSDGFIWMCRRKTHHEVTLSIRAGSLFSLQLRQTDFIEDGVAQSSTTLSKMSALLRKICIKALSHMKRECGQRLGGKSRRKFVAIDESKFAHKRKVCIW
ncbi:hypothetical protein AOLI_G00173720 [Acnodon oligacanthus]